MTTVNEKLPQLTENLIQSFLEAVQEFLYAFSSINTPYGDKSFLSNLRFLLEDRFKEADFYIDKGEIINHSLRTSYIKVKISERLGFEPQNLPYIIVGSILHDIGKFFIPDYILSKRNSLTHEEWDKIKKHPIYAYEIISNIDKFQSIVEIPYYHHERWNGNGYPKGIKRNDIPLSARIFAVADVFDALTNDRPYRPAWTKDKAVEYIKSRADIDFDPFVVNTFVQLVNESVI